ncbi:MAG: MGMT family protein [Candidatus Nomurabacteria bacterium]|nr:MGMT family protein [Candidatus Nomurabacteria bacterium]USN87938.1 MAG: MGMT family protein [Candidatus Nomurabacteria bacterium]
MQKNKNSFRDKVNAVVRQIPAGQTKSYAEVAKLAGHPKAYRAVASLMAKNFDPSIPCHRVIRSDGKVGEYNRGGEQKKRELLKAEGWQS